MQLVISSVVVCLDVSQRRESLRKSEKLALLQHLLWRKLKSVSSVIFVPFKILDTVQFQFTLAIII